VENRRFHGDSSHHTAKKLLFLKAMALKPYANA
jgi:hypothetical protein